MKAAFERRGFDYLDPTDLERYLNDAYLLDVCEEEDWPFLEATSEGEAPLEIADLRTVEYVIDKTLDERLDPLKRARITDELNADITETGTPGYYYLTGGNTVNVYPVAADTLLVRYWKAPEALSGTDEPLLPSRFHTLPIDGAVARAYEDSDDYELAEAAKARFDKRLDAMAESLGMLQRDAPDDLIVITDPAALG